MSNNKNEIKEFKIADKKIGLEEPIFLSAEVGTTCNGDVKTAKKIIDVAKETGLDAVKFQILDPEDKFSDKENLKFNYTRNDGEKVSENIYEMLKQYVMTKEEWIDLKDYADNKGIIMFATPDHIAAVDLMEELGMPAYKIATWDVNFVPLMRKIAKTGKPTIVDLGASNKEEVAEIVDLFRKYNNDKIILLHCFHTNNYKEMNMRTVEYLRKQYNCFSGFSAPDFNNELDYMSLPYKPVYIEKRLTLNRDDPNHHHSQALEPDEMKDYVGKIRDLSLARGVFDLVPTPSDLKFKKEFFRRIVAKKPIKNGDVLSSDNICSRRPYEGGIDAINYDSVIGKKSKKDFNTNDPIEWEDI